jgi:hypothetical protein
MKSALPRPSKHHYVPRFYLKRWTGEDGKLCEFSKPNGRVVPRRVYPAETGFTKRLYSMPEGSDDAAADLETMLFSPIDGGAAAARDAMLNTGATDALSDHHRLAWSRFMHSMLLRCPQDLQLVRGKWIDILLSGDEEYERRFARDSPSGSDMTLKEAASTLSRSELEQSALDHLAQIIANPKVVGVMAEMEWHIVATRPQDRLLLTSDCPVIRTNGIFAKHGHLAVPISPRHVFLACSDRRTLDTILGLGTASIVRAVNTLVIEGAHTFAYGTDDLQRRFVENRMSKSPAPRLAEVVLRGG